LSPKPAIEAATDVTIATSFLAVMRWPWRPNSRRATFISASRLIEPDGIQSAPRFPWCEYVELRVIVQVEQARNDHPLGVDHVNRFGFLTAYRLNDAPVDRDLPIGHQPTGVITAPRRLNGPIGSAPIDER
jgi:hypothetical protein